MNNKRKILSCALNLFYQKGYDSVGIQEICQEAGITKPTLYHYFGSKLGLLEILLKEEFTDLIDRAGEVAVAEERVEQALYDFADVIFEFAYRNPRAYMFLMALSYSAKDNEVYQAVKPYISRLYSVTVEMFENAAGQLGNMNGRQEQFAIGYLGTINHYIMFQCFKEETNSVTRVSKGKVESLIRQFMYGIWT